MNNVHNFHYVHMRHDPIDRDEGQGRQRKLAGTLHAAESPCIREIAKCTPAIVNRLTYSLRRRRIIPANVFGEVI
jgi:hypothetical protein